ncbi:MAG: DNA-binding protein HU [Bacteroidetes bacterium]|nr:MAG: DNA-binding protein HU [Bacteroidota bacterium]PIE87840.1 MAG: DNA-binding protein HU [Bacteroidota bacterium]
MNKTELINFVAEETGLTKIDAQRALEACMKGVTETLAAGERVQLTGFGTFYVDARAARTGRNPRTGQEIAISAKRIAKFKAGKGLSDAVM